MLIIAASWFDIAPPIDIFDYAAYFDISRYLLRRRRCRLLICYIAAALICIRYAGGV